MYKPLAIIADKTADTNDMARTTVAARLGWYAIRSILAITHAMVLAQLTAAAIYVAL